MTETDAELIAAVQWAVSQDNHCPEYRLQIERRRLARLCDLAERALTAERLPAIAVIRLFDGAVDDVAITCDMLRLEQMDSDRWWIAAERADGTHTMFDLCRQGKRVVATCYEDTIGCVDDRAERKEASK